MECIVKKYGKGNNKLPVFVEEAEATYAVILRDHPIIEDELDSNEFFKLSYATLDLTLDVNRLDPKIKTWFTKTVLKEFIIGIYFENNSIVFNGYIDEESVEIDKATRDYLVTAISWWKYFYEVVGNEPCPYSNTLTGNGQIEFFLRLAFLCDIITEVEVNIDNTIHGIRPYINMEKYQRFAPLMTIKEMVDNYHKKLVGVFVIRGTKLIFNQYHKTYGAQKDITHLVLKKNEITDRIISYTGYDAVAVNEYGCNFFRRMINEKLVSTYAGDDLEFKDPRWNILDLTEKLKDSGAEGLWCDVGILSETTLKVLDIKSDDDKEYIDYPPNFDWIDKSITLNHNFESYRSRWRGRITDVNGDVLTVAWLGKLDGNWDTKPNTYPYNSGIYYAQINDIQEIDSMVTYDIDTWNYHVKTIEDISVISNKHIFTSADFIRVAKIINLPKDGLNNPYLNKDVLYKVFEPKSSFSRTINTVDINVLDEVVLNDEVLKVIRVSKDLVDMVSEVELEETGKPIYPPPFN